jgi:hypothetical protein
VKKGYTSPAMMEVGLQFFGRKILKVRRHLAGLSASQPSIEGMFAGPMTLVRIQWTGPWCRGGNWKWAARQTHWIATWAERGVWLLFDCNGGIRGLSSWEQEIAPKLIAMHPRADGGWYPANIWRLVDP